MRSVRRMLRVARASGGALAGAVAVALTLVALQPIQPAGAESAAMTLLRQDLALGADAALTITFLPPEPVTVTDTIVVGAYRRIENRADRGARTELAAAMDGTYGRVVDSVQLTPSDASSFDVAEDGSVTITVATESTSNTPLALQFPRTGLYPVTVDVQDAGGALVGELLTFVDRLPTGDDPDRGRLGVSVVASVTASPALPGADRTLDDDVVAQIGDLVKYPAALPLTIGISPEVLDRIDAKSLADLREVAGRSVVLAEPSLPLDPAAAAAAGRQDLFTRWLRAGEDEVSSRLGVRPTRAAWIEAEPLTTEGATLLRDLGIGVVVLSSATYADAAAGVEGGNLGSYTLFTQLRSIRLPEASSMPTAVVDPTIDRHLVDESISPELAALYTAADLVAWRDQLFDGAHPLAGNTAVLGMPHGGVFASDRIVRLQQMAAGTHAVTFHDVSTLARDTDVQKIGDADATLTLSPQVPVDLAARDLSLAAVEAREETVASMLVDGRDRAVQWERTIETLRSSSVTDDQVAEASAALLTSLASIADAVVAPTPYTFTMNGLSANIIVRITNNGDEPLQVVVRMRASADKMHFPAGDQLETLPPRAVKDVKVPVRARSNGSFTVTVQVLAPAGPTPITDATILTARVNALTGLAQLLTGGALLVLLTWWVRHLRRSRRTRQHLVAMDGHPSQLRRAHAVALDAPDVQPETPADVTAVAAPAVVTATATTGTATIAAANATAATVTVTSATTRSPDPATDEREASGAERPATLSDS